MELKSLLLGLAFSFTFFAFKSGAGVYYLLAAMPGKARRRLQMLGFAVSYGITYRLGDGSMVLCSRYQIKR